MGKSQREKGKVGERWLAKELRSFGFSASRGVQYKGGPDSPDVLCPVLPYHWEMKWGYKQGLSIRKVLHQAEEEGGTLDIAPIGVWKPQREDAVAFMYLQDLLKLLRRAYPDDQGRVQPFEEGDS